ncbi:hypothetical protein BGZ94_006014 [Podila epigama]|nr:hypothetical protein BGZ94_006014 [Podila epigama]
MDTSVETPRTPQNPTGPAPHDLLIQPACSGKDQLVSSILLAIWDQHWASYFDDTLFAPNGATNAEEIQSCVRFTVDRFTFSVLLVQEKNLEKAKRNLEDFKEEKWKGSLTQPTPNDATLEDANALKRRIQEEVNKSMRLIPKDNNLAHSRLKRTLDKVLLDQEIERNGPNKKANRVERSG